MKRMHRRLIIFTDKFPLLGPSIYMLCVQYLIVQPIVASAWPLGYSWRNNYISDLGNTVCGSYAHRLVCSPEYALMNRSFIMLGLTMAVGSLLIYQEFRKSRLSLLGFSLMAAGGVGTILVGAFPENTIAALHGLGAVFGLLVGNLSLIVLSLALTKVPRSLRIYTLLTGLFTVVSFILFTQQITFGLGQGGMERLVSYPQTLWLTLFGLYMTRTHLRAR